MAKAKPKAADDDTPATVAGHQKPDTARTAHGHLLYECVSAFQKSVRRQMVDDALYWAFQIVGAGFGKYLWRRVRIIVSEDIGLAAPGLAAEVLALQTFWEDQKSEKYDNGQSNIYISHMAILLARAPKSRMADNAQICHVHFADDRRREVPDHAVDKHTGRGKNSDPPRGIIHFKEVGSKLVGEPEDLFDVYKAAAEKYMIDVW
ncbi:MAG: hypothetical protein ACRC7O_02960, partial [Fimbriiglobus sp.]